MNPGSAMMAILGKPWLATFLLDFQLNQGLLN